MLKKIIFFLIDVWKVFRGFCSIIRYIIFKERITASLSSFSAEEGYVNFYKTNIYKIKFLNNACEPKWFDLVIDIYYKDNPVHPEGHYAYFSKKVFAGKLESKTMLFSYDWQNNALFFIDNISLPPDNQWIGNCTKQGFYHVKIILKNMSNNFIVDELFITQEMV